MLDLAVDYIKDLQDQVKVNYSTSSLLFHKFNNKIIFITFFFLSLFFLLVNRHFQIIEQSVDVVMNE